MTGDNDKLDNIYKNSFSEYELPVSDKVLLNIKKELFEKKRKRIVVFWRWSIGLSLTIGTTIFLLTNSGKNNKQIIPAAQSIDSTIDIKENVVSILENESRSSDNSEKSKEIEIKNNSTTLSVGSIPKNENDSPANSKKTKDVLSKNNPTTSSAASPQAKTKVRETASTPMNRPLQDNNTLVKNNAERNKSKTNAEKDNDQAMKQKSVIKTIQIKPSSEIAKEQQNNNTLVDEKNKDLVLKSKEEKDKNLNDSIKSAEVTDKLVPKKKSPNTISDSLTKKQDSIKTEDSLIVSDTLKPKANAQKNIDENKTTTDKNYFFVELNGGPSLSYRSLSGNNASVTSRNDMEKKQLNYNAEANFGMTINNKFLLSIGIGIENKGEQYLFPEKKETGTRFDSIPIYDTTGTIIAYNIDTIPTELFFPEYKTQNKYQFIKLPIMIGYCFTIKEKWSITPIVGVNINYLLSASSSWFDPETQQIVSYTKVNKSFSSFSIAGRIKLDIGMNITDKWSISIQPGYTRFLKSIYRKNDSIKLYPYSYDLHVGIRYRL